MSFESKKTPQKESQRNQNNQSQILPQSFNPNITITDSALSINTEKIESSKLEECSSISPNLDDTYANLIDTKEIYDIFSLVILKLTSISSLSSDSINTEQVIEEIKNMVDNLKTSINNKIEQDLVMENSDLKMLRKHIRAKSTETMRKKVKQLKGDKYSHNLVISNIKEFEQFYNTIIPYEFKEKEKVSFEDALKSKYLFI